MNEKQPMSLRNLSLGALLVCLLGLVLMLNLTSPDDISPAVLLVMFVLMYGVVFGGLTISLVFFQSLNQLFFPNAIKKKPINLRKTYSYIAIISCVPIFVLAVQSIKSIDGFEVLLVLTLASVACFVVYKKY